MSGSGWARRLGVLLAVALCLGCARATPTPVPPFASTESPPTTTALPTAAEPVAVTSAPTALPDAPWIVGSVALFDLPGQGRSPQDIVALGERLYVVNAGSANVSVIEGERVAATIRAGAEPVAVAADAAGGRVYVLDQRQGQVLVIDGEDVLQRWPVPAGSSSLAVVGEALWVGTGDGRLVAHSLAGGGELRTIALSEGAPVLRIVPDPRDETRAAAVTYGRIHLVALDKGAEIAVAEVGIWRALAYAPDGSRLYAGGYDAPSQGHRLLVLDAADLSVIGEAGLPSSPRAVLADAAGERVYIALPEEHAVLALAADGLEPAWQTKVGREPVALALGAGVLYAACAGSDQIARLDVLTGSRISPIPLAARISALAVGLEGVWAALGSADQVAVLGEGGVSERWPTESAPDRLVWLPEQGQIAVLSAAGGTLTLRSPDGGPVEPYQVGSGATALFHDRAHEMLYAGGMVLDFATGLTATVAVETSLGMSEPPALVAVDIQRGITYLVAGNGVLGSNYGLIAYRLEDDGTTTPGGPGRLSTVDLLYDEAADLFYSVYERMGAYGLQVWDPSTESERLSLPLPRRPVALALNPTTQHLWVALGGALRGDGAGDGALWAYDTRTMGVVTELAFGGPITALVVDAQANRVYAACDADQAVWVIQDLVMPAPAEPPSAAGPASSRRASEGEQPREQGIAPDARYHGGDHTAGAPGHQDGGDGC